jgi:hypothetical protein
MFFMAVQILFWLSLATWFGGVLFVTLAPPIILRTVRENNPLLPTVLAVNLEGQHSTLLAGSIVTALVEPLMRLELAAAGGVFLAMIGQWFEVGPENEAIYLGLIRSALFLLGIVFFLYRWRVVWPRMIRHRAEYVEHADEPEIANPALDRFDRDQGEILGLLRNLLFVLIGLILFSASIRPAFVIHAQTIQSQPAH